MIDAARFLDALRRRREKYRQMLRASEEQKRILKASDLDALLGLLDLKRRILGEIDALERELRPFREQWSRIRAGLDPALVREAETQVAETRRTLEQIVRLEEQEGQDLVRPRYEQDKEDLFHKRAALRAYSRP